MGGGEGCRCFGRAVAAIMANTSDSLDTLNSNPNFDLKNVLEIFFGDDNEENSFINDNHAHKYFDHDTFSSKFSNNSIIFLSLNVCSLMSKHQNLSTAINDMLRKQVKIKVIAVQETWNVPYPELVNINGFKLFIKTRSNNRGGGIAFFVKDDITCKIKHNLSPFYEKEFECLTVEIVLNKKKLLLSNIYRSPTPTTNATLSEHTDSFINHLDVHLSNLSSLNTDSYVFMDSNINLLKINHSQSAALYLETIFANGFLQKIGKATRIQGNSFSLIDHILTKTEVNVEISGTIISDISDHFKNFVALPCQKSRVNTDNKPKRNFSQFNLRCFKEALGLCTWNSTLVNNDVNDSYNNFWSDFHTLFELHFPLIKVKFNRNVHKKNNFMTKGLLISRSTKNNLHKKAINNPNLYSEHYRIYRNIFNSLVRISKQKYIDENFRKHAKNPKRTWDLLKETTFGERSQINLSEIKVNGEPKTNPTDISEEFNNFFTSIGQSISNNVVPTTINPESYLNEYDPLKTKFNLGNTGQIHVMDIIKSFESKASPDIDGISLKLIKLVAYEISRPLSHIFNLSLKNGVFPENLKSSRTVPIFKCGDPKLCDNYRPISLVCTISKILEKMVHTNLINHLEINDLLYKHQYGFLKGKSTEQNLLHVVNFISNALNSGNFCIGIFLDLKKAFDVCSHSILLKKLKKLGVEGVALDWFTSYLSNRKQRVDINGHLSSEKSINISVLQGSILGPTLFLCYINDLFTVTNLATFLFADDTSCLAEHNNLPELINFVNVELQKISNWFRSNKMAVNISKTKFIIFRTKGKKIDISDTPVLFNNNDLNGHQDPNNIFKLERVFLDNINPEHQTYKLLGVHFDEYLNFDKHSSYICAKLARSLYCIKRVSNKLSKKSLLSLYYALIHPHLLYCINILSCTSKSNLLRIQKMQKKAIRIITKSKANEHTGPLFKSSKILPFEQLCLQAKLLFMHSIHYNYAPPSFSNTFPTNQVRNIEHNLRNQHEFILPGCRIELFKKFPLYTFPLAWNNLGDIGFQPNRTTFHFALKDYLLESIL